MATSQQIEFHDLTHTQGLLALNLGKTLVTTHYNNLIHIVDLNNLETTTLAIKNTLNKLEENTTFFYNPDLQRSAQNLLDKVYSLKINHRHTRGLIDGLGSVIKKITGNMDNDDALEINKQIRNLQDNSLLTQDSINNQHKLNSQMIQRFSNITKFINKEQARLQIISESIKNFSNIEHRLLATQVYFSLQTQITTLTDHVDNIIQSVQLAQLGLLSKHILSKSELSLVKSKLPQIIQNYNDEQIYEILELKAYFNNTNLIFAVQIPQMTNESYTTYRLRPLPTNHSTIIIPKSNYLFLNQKQYSFVTKPCKQIEQLYMCKQLQLQNNSINTCEVKILQNEPAQCTLHHTVETSFIEEIESNHIIAYVNEPININTTCGKNITKFTGKLYIHYNKCMVIINGIIYGTISSSISTYKLEQIIYNNMEITQLSNDSTLDVLNLKTLENTNELELIKYQHFTHISTNIVILIIFLISTFIFSYIKYYKNRKNRARIIENIKYTPSAPQEPVELTQKTPITFLFKAPS